MGAYPLLEGEKRPIVLFDTECLLCNRTVQFLLKTDRRKQLYFAGIKSQLGKEVLDSFQIFDDSVVFYHKGTCLIKSSAFISIARILGFPYTLLIVLRIFPVKLRDVFYDFIARNRFKWFGRTDHCIIPQNDFKDRLLS